MALTSIGSQKTPGRPIEITFAAETGLPTDDQELLIIGRRGASGASGSVADYSVNTISNAGDLTAASAEVATKFGDGSELAKMVLAAIRANTGEGTVPAIKAIPLANDDTDFGATDEALTAAQNVKAEFIVSPFDATNTTLRDKLKDHCLLVSGAQRVENNQFGSFGVVANMSVSDTDSLDSPDTQYIIPIWYRDTGTGDDLNDYIIGEVAAACAAKMASNISPFNPLDNETIVGIDAPAQLSDYISVGAGLESEAALGKGWTPLRVKPNGEVSFVRTVTSRITVDADGVTAVTAYYDVQDFQVLYFWRKTVFTRLNQSDLKQVKASNRVASNIRGELLRLARLFEDQQMFQAVDKLGKLFEIERNLSDRHRFDIKTPVNVIPGLHVVATNIEATTQFDTITL